jgi:hypothetical protein
VVADIDRLQEFSLKKRAFRAESDPPQNRRGISR